MLTFVRGRGRDRHVRRRLAARRRRSLTRIAFLLALGVPAQAVIGGITVLTDLNPWIVSFHLLVSLAMVGLSVVLLRRIDEGDGPPGPAGPGRRRLADPRRCSWWAGWCCTSGPWSPAAVRTRATCTPRATGSTPGHSRQLHTDVVFLLVGLTVAAVLVLHSSGAPSVVRRAAWTLLAVELAQGVVGFVQYFTDLPVVLVGDPPARRGAALGRDDVAAGHRERKGHRVQVMRTPPVRI